MRTAAMKGEIMTELKHRSYRNKLGDRLEVRPHQGFGGFTIYVDGMPNWTDRRKTEAEAQARLDKRAVERGYEEVPNETR